MLEIGYTCGMTTALTWHEWKGYGDSLDLSLPAGAGWLWFDLLLDANWFATFALCWLDADGAEIRREHIAPLTECQTRIALPVAAGVGERLVLRVARGRRNSPSAVLSRRRS
jgi:hypothetical protein